MSTRGNVLVVDDEPYVRDSIAAVLRRKRFDVRTAAGYDEAVDPRSLDSIDAVIADLKMPGRNGYELLRDLGKLDPAPPVIILTGNGSVPSAVECMKGGSFDYLMKPAKSDELIRLVESAVAESKERRRFAAKRRAERAAAAARAESVPAAESSQEGGAPPLHLRSSLAETERKILEEALRRSGGVRRQAARLLGIDERNLSYFLRKHDLS